jgi:hypothetical protein
MAQANPILIAALRQTAQNLRQGAAYTWGHHGQCNCGNLAQVITPYSDEEIQRFAHSSAGEWTELAEAHCDITGAPVDMMVHRLMEIGLTPTDIHHIEYLSDKAVLKFLSGGFRWLKRNQRTDAILYFEAMADMLDDQLADQLLVQELQEEAVLVLTPV